jgi:hypothetical protein
VIASLAATGVAAACLSLGLLVGLRLAPTLRPLRSALIQLAATTALGIGAYATALLLVTAVAGVRAGPIWMTTLGLAVLAAPAMRRVPLLLRDAVAEWRRLANPLAHVALLGAAVALWLAAAPVPVDFDSLMYHLRGPEQYLLAGRIWAPPGNPHVAFVGALHTPYLAFLLLGVPAAAALMQAGFTLLAFVAAAAAGDRWLHARAGWLVAVLLLGGPILLRVGATPMIESGLALLLFSAHLLLLDAFRRPADGARSAAMGGALLGLAVGTKILAAAYAIALGATLLPALLLRRRARPQAVRLVGIALAMSALTAAPWLARTALLYGSPTAPYMMDASLPAWATAPDAALELPSGTGTLRNVREPFTLRAWFFEPGSLTPEGDGYLFGANLAFAALVLLPFIGRRSRVALLVLPALGYLGLVLGWSFYLNLRYLIPVFLPLTVAAAAPIALLGRRALRGRPGTWAAAGVGIALTITPVTMLMRELEFSERPKAALGLMPADHYRRRRDEVAALRLYLNTAMPPDARVLFLFEARAFGVVRDVVQDNTMENWRLLRPLAARGSCFEELGLTHIVVSNATLNYLLRRGWDRDAVGIPELEAFLTRCSSGGMGDALHTVYALKPRS